MGLQNSKQPPVTALIHGSHDTKNERRRGREKYLEIDGEKDFAFSDREGMASLESRKPLPAHLNLELSAWTARSSKLGSKDVGKHYTYSNFPINKNIFLYKYTIIVLVTRGCLIIIINKIKIIRLGNAGQR